MNEKIEVRAMNRFGEEVVLNISPRVTVGELLERAARELQLDPADHALMVRGEQVPPHMTLQEVDIRHEDRVAVVPKFLDSENISEMAFEIARRIVFMIIGNYLHDGLSGDSLGKLTKQTFLGCVNEFSLPINVEKNQKDEILEKIAENLEKELKIWEEIGKEHGAKILQKLISEGVVSNEKIKDIAGSNLRVKEILDNMILSENVEIEFHLKRNILKETGDLLVKILRQPKKSEE
ncbi:hypothetical protein KY335_05335 [Candidatus Woesearchaeota archaeon]|nr:hypothetical protein [Candidatus Woesearchaeota archaeon]